MKPGKVIKRLAATLIAVLALATPALARDCADLARQSLPNGKVTSATLVAAGAFQQPPSPFPLPPGVPPISYAGLPAFCRVTATLTPSADSDIKIEVWLPAQGWNGKFVGIGNGIWAGQISYAEMGSPLTRGYAVASTDTGHVGNGLTADWADGHHEKLVDFGYRAIHEMTVKAKAIATAFYGKAPTYSFWNSCSTGGRQGLMEAYRYPADYDAISAMAPANPMTDLMTQSIWTGYQAVKDPGSRVPPPKLAVLHKAYVAACDEKDGLKDGLVANPQACSFDPAVTQCADADGPTCLTAVQVATMRAIYAGPADANGKPVLAGFPAGSEVQLAVVTMGAEPFPVATSYMRLFVMKDRAWDFRTFDYGRDTIRSREAEGKNLDVPADGLKPFFARGGKLLLSHGWSDGLIPANNTLAFYKGLMGAVPAAQREKLLRLFMVPDMQHCGGGDGPFAFDTIGTVDAWATTGKAPERIVASRPGPAPGLTRPLCVYPQTARYKGQGDTNDAANFACVAS